MIIRNTENFKSKVSVTFKETPSDEAITELIASWCREGHEIKLGGTDKEAPKTVWVKFFNRAAANDFSEKIVSLKNKNI